MPLLLSHHHHRLLLLLLVAVAACHGNSSDDGTYDPSMCLNQTYTCGGVRISYPFYLSGETKDLKGNDNSYCGYPGLGILCDDDKPILQLGGTANYTVKSIDGASATVSLADPEVVNGSCPKVDHNVTIPPNSWLEFPDSTVDYIFFYLGCNFSNNSGLVQPPSIGNITCQGFNSGYFGRLSFVIPDDEVPPGNWSQACEQIFKVPVLKHGPVDPKDAGWVNGGYGMVLSKGFQLTWDDKKPTPCMQCEQSNGRCAYNQTGGFQGCLCSNGRVNDDKNCRNSNAGHGDSKTRIKIYTIAGSSSIIMLCLLFFAFWLGYKKCGPKRKSKETARIESYLQKNGTVYPKRYTYAQVKRMTRSFAEKLGQGGFGAVYKGSLSDGRQIAVKINVLNSGLWQIAADLKISYSGAIAGYLYMRPFSGTLLKRL